MPQANAQVQYLPSLLDRLTDDDPVTQSIQNRQKTINKLEKELTRLVKKADNADAEDDFQQKKQALEKKLTQERHTCSVLAASVNSLKEVRACVIRDLDWLLNAHSYSPAEDLEAYPEVANSVINYGLPDFAGLTASSIDVRYLEKIFKQAIIDFEPRILKNSLKVKLLADESMQDHNALIFEIDAEVWSEPLPIHLHLRTEVELESGGISVAELDR